MPDDKLERALNFLKMANENRPSTADVITIFRAIMQKVSDLHQSLHDSLTDHRRETNIQFLRHKDDVDRALDTHEQTHAKKDDVKLLRQRFNDSMMGISIRLETVANSIPEKTDLEPIYGRISELESKKHLTLDDVQNLEPTHYRNKIESLEGDDRMKITSLSGYEEFREEMLGLMREERGTGMIVAQSRGAVVSYDLSSQLNGVLKQFLLPAFGQILLVQSTSTPLIFQPNVDYTVDGKAMTITFASGINAATTLAAGQTLLVLYAEN